MMQNWKDIDYLKCGTPSQKNAWKLLRKTRILDRLSQYNPVVIGTVPIDIDVEQSDIDIACEVYDSAEFIQTLKRYYPDIAISQHDDVIIARMSVDHTDFEIYGDKIPVTQQHGYIHMIVEAMLLELGGDPLRNRVRELKRNGMKTEPAFAQALEIRGDPYEELAKLKDPSQFFIPTEIYRKRFGLTEATFTRIDHGETMIATVYRVTQPSKDPLILKVCAKEEEYDRELFFLQRLAEILPVPSIIDSVEPESNIRGAILMGCLEGHLLQEDDWTDSLAYEIGSNLARLHLNRTQGYGELTGSQELTTSPGMYFENKFREELAECSNHLPKQLIEKLENFFTSHRNLLNEVDGPCMVHRDFRPGNMIVCHGKLQGIIDWASARSGFAEQDFCNMEHRKWPNKRALLAGYASIRPVPPFQTVMPLLRLGRAIAVIGFAVKSGTWNGKNQNIYQYNRRFLEGFLLGGEGRDEENGGEGEGEAGDHGGDG